MVNSVAIESFMNAHDFLEKKIRELLLEGVNVKTSNEKNKGTLKDELIELPHQFFCIEDPCQTVFDVEGFKTQPWWMVAEILTEFLNLNPPLMMKYRDDLIKSSYILME